MRSLSRMQVVLALLCIILLASCATTSSSTLPTPEEAASQGKQSVKLATMIWQDASSTAATLCNRGALSLTDCQKAQLHTETARKELTKAAAYLDGDRTIYGTFNEFYSLAYNSIIALQGLIKSFQGGS